MRLQSTRNLRQPIAIGFHPELLIDQTLMLSGLKKHWQKKSQIRSKLSTQVRPGSLDDPKAYLCVCPLVSSGFLCIRSLASVCVLCVCPLVSSVFASRCIRPLVSSALGMPNASNAALLVATKASRAPSGSCCIESCCCIAAGQVSPLWMSRQCVTSNTRVKHLGTPPTRAAPLLVAQGSSRERKYN